MGLRIKVENGELTNSARQSIRGAPDSMVEDTCIALGNEFVGFRLKVENGELTNSARQLIRGAPDVKMEDT